MDRGNTFPPNALKALLAKNIIPSDSLWFSDRGLRLGSVDVMTHADDIDPRSERLEALLAIAFRRRLSAPSLQQIMKAAAASRAGDQSLANLRLGLAGLSRVPGSHDFEERAAMAQMLLAHGMTAAELLSELDLGPPDVAKYDPDQLRVPAGHGHESGRWTDQDGRGGGASAASTLPGIVLRAAPLLAPDLGAATLAAVAAVAGTVGFAAVAGVLFVPWQNAVSNGGPLPGPGGNSYSYDGDEGLLRVLGPSGDVLAAGHKDRSGVFVDADTGVPFARAVGDAILFGRDAAMAVAHDDEEAGSVPRALSRTEVDDDEPKLCPEPGSDQPGSNAASDRAKAYQEQISRMINPQRPLAYGLAMSLINPLTGRPVHYDDCDEESGAMIDAKGPGYAKLLQFAPVSDNVTKEWLRQSAIQLSAAGTRRIEWYFAEQSAADYARDLFAERDAGRERIIIKVQSAEKL